MDRLISEQAVLDVIEFEDKWLLDCKSHNEDTRIAFDGMKSKVKAIPSAEPYKGMTNGEVIKTVFPNIDTNFSNVIDLKLWWDAKYKAERSE